MYVYQGPASLTNMQTICVDSLSDSQSTKPVNLEPQQLPEANNQSAVAAFLPMVGKSKPVNSGSQQLFSSDKYQAQTSGQASLSVNLTSTSIQSAMMESPVVAQTPVSMYVNIQQLSAGERRPLEVHPLVNIQTSWFANMDSQPSPLATKRLAQIEASSMFLNKMSSIQGSQQPLPTKKRPAQAELMPKVKADFLDSVRSKLRESLAEALGVASQQSQTQTVERTLCDTAATTIQAEAVTLQDGFYSKTVIPASEGTPLETLISNEHCQICDESRSLSSDIGSTKSERDKLTAWNCDVQENKPKHALLDAEASFANNSVIQDELLQGHGLCWAFGVDADNSEAMLNLDQKRPKLAEQKISGNIKETAIQVRVNLATKIEGELFRLFGGVNKKYKEKGRSLLFNLKDRNNPELRERILSGEIAPERLCSMTAEELASKELSQWRLAKAEELQQMVVLPDSDVDIRRLVKKTHKGEVQVEVEDDGSVSVEIGLGANLPSKVLLKSIEEAESQPRSADKGQILSKISETKKPEDMQLMEKAGRGGSLSSSLETLTYEKTDVKEYVVDELKHSTCLPPVVSLDEFRVTFDKEPPFEDLPMYSKQDHCNSAGNNSYVLEPDIDPASDRLVPKPDAASNNMGLKLDPSQYNSTYQLHSTKAIQGHPTEAATGSGTTMHDKNTRLQTSLSLGSVHVQSNMFPSKNLISSSVHAQSDTWFADSASMNENIWEGLLQLNTSALAMVIGFFIGGERASTQEWPSFLEIKGRVRLDAFEKFMQELPLSRSRVIMVAQFCWKEGSPQSGRLHLCEAATSYIAGKRVGYAEPAPGVELYLCPAHQRASEMLGRYLRKGLHLAADGLIGVIVWRRPYASISPRLPSSQHKHKKHSAGSEKEKRAVDTTVVMINPGPADDDVPVPPGFGPAGAASDEDDLPEFDFSSTMLQINPSSQPPRTANLQVLRPANPVEHMRELIQKYGRSGDTTRTPTPLELEPWNDDDDIPEWRQPPQTLHGYQQHAMKRFVPRLPQPPLQQQHVPLGPQLSMPQMAGLNMPSWPPSHGPNNTGLFTDGVMQPGYFRGRPYGALLRNGLGWRLRGPGV